MRKAVAIESDSIITKSVDNLDVCSANSVLFLPIMLLVSAQLDCEKVYCTAMVNYMFFKSY